jgi:hypothetical protein
MNVIFSRGALFHATKSGNTVTDFLIYNFEKLPGYLANHQAKSINQSMYSTGNIA